MHRDGDGGSCGLPLSTTGAQVTLFLGLVDIGNCRCAIQVKAETNHKVCMVYGKASLCLAGLKIPSF